MAKTKKLSKKYWKICIEFALAFQCETQSNERIHLCTLLTLERMVALKTNAIQTFQYFFDNFFVFSQWPVIFYISNINTSLYRFLLKVFNFGIYTSLPFLVSWYSSHRHHEDHKFYLKKFKKSFTYSPTNYFTYFHLFFKTTNYLLLQNFHLNYHYRWKFFTNFCSRCS